MSFKIRRIARARDKRADMMLQEAIIQSDLPPLHAETHRPTGTDPILPSDIGAETPAGAQAKADAALAAAKAYTDQEVGEVSQELIGEVSQELIDEVSQELNAHLNDKNNPHNVVPEQIGAETPAGAQTKADVAEARAKAYTDQEVGEVSQELAAHKAEIATSTQLGHVKVGQNLAIDSDGTLHAQASGGKKVARFVIGTSTAGWAENDVDYLCDGVDDQVEIQQALNALPATGGEVVILDGTYNITAPIRVNKDNVSIRGNGNATVLKRMWDSSSSEGVITLTSVQGCRVENLQIDGNKATYTASGNYSIRLHSSSNNTITGNTCNNSSNGINLVISNNNIITGNTCNNNNVGIYLYSSSNNIITGNTCNNNDMYGIRLETSSNNTVTGNIYNNNNYGIYLYSSSNNIITGNTCNNNDRGILLYLSSNNNTITGNACIRGTGTPGDYTTDQYTIILVSTNNNYNLISLNNCMGKAPVVQGGTGNTVLINKWDASDGI